jgi:hypothetical protein
MFPFFWGGSVSVLTKLHYIYICIICTYRDRNSFTQTAPFSPLWLAHSSRQAAGCCCYTGTQEHRKHWHPLYVRQTVCASYWKVSVFFCWHRNIRLASLSFPAATGTHSLVCPWLEKFPARFILKLHYIHMTWCITIQLSSFALPRQGHNFILIELMSAACVIMKIPAILRNPQVRCRVHNTHPWARLIRSMPSNYISSRFILILSSHVRLKSSKWSPSYQNFVCVSLLSLACYIPRPCHQLFLVTNHLRLSQWYIYRFTRPLVFSAVTPYSLVNGQSHLETRVAPVSSSALTMEKREFCGYFAPLWAGLNAHSVEW